MKKLESIVEKNDTLFKSIWKKMDLERFRFNFFALIKSYPTYNCILN